MKRVAFFVVYVIALREIIILKFLLEGVERERERQTIY